MVVLEEKSWYQRFILQVTKIERDLSMRFLPPPEYTHKFSIEAGVLKLMRNICFEGRRFTVEPPVCGCFNKSNSLSGSMINALLIITGVCQAVQSFTVRLGDSC